MSKPKKKTKCRNCEHQRRLYQRVARDEIAAHNRRETILVSEVVSLESNLNDAVWMLWMIAGRLVELEGQLTSRILTPADKTQITQWHADRTARLKKVLP